MSPSRRATRSTSTVPVSGAGLATLGGGLAAHRPDLVEGVGIIVGIDRFMSEARALTNFAGNAVATVLVGNWVGEFDRARAQRVLAGEDPFDETTMLDDEPDPAAGSTVPKAAETAETDPKRTAVAGTGHI